MWVWVKMPVFTETYQQLLELPSGVRTSDRKDQGHETCGDNIETVSKYGFD